jgi:hypothetical protein
MILLVGIAIFPLLLVYIYCLSRSVLFGWISLLAVLFYDFSFGATIYVIGGLNITVVDIVEICLLVAGIARTIPRLSERSTGRRIAIAYLFFFAFSLARGIAAHGTSHAGNGSRIFVGFLIALLYFLTAPVDSHSVRMYIRAYLYYGLGLVLVACLAYGGLDVGAVAWEHHDPVRELMNQGRLLPGACALTLAFCFFYSLAESQYKKCTIVQKWLPAVFLGLAIFLRTRTVWIVLAAGSAPFLFVDRKLLRRLVPIASIAIFIILGYGLISGIAVKMVESQLAESAANKQTWLFRIAMWQSLLGGTQTVSGTLFGKDLGGGYRVFNLRFRHFVNIPPHNEYVAQYLSVGIVGVALLLWFTIRPLKRFWKLSSTDMQVVEPSASAWVAVIIGIIAFSIPYQPMADAYGLLAIANAMVFRLDNEAREKQQESSALVVEPGFQDGQLHGL